MKGRTYLGVVLLVLLFFTNLDARTVLTRDFEFRLRGKQIPSTWVYPRTGPYKAWILLQHGFMRNKDHMRDLATILAKDGYMVITPTLSKDQLTGKRFIESFATLIIKKKFPKPRFWEELPENFILSGLSLGATFAARAGEKLHKEHVERFKGVLLFDPVDLENKIKDSFNTLKGTGLVLSIFSRPSQCNLLNSVANHLPKLEALFPGVRLLKGTHCDAEGDSSDWLCYSTCGLSRPKSVLALKTLTKGWIDFLLNGPSDFNFSYFPGGAIYLDLFLADLITRL